MLMVSTTVQLHVEESLSQTGDSPLVVQEMLVRVSGVLLKSLYSPEVATVAKRKQPQQTTLRGRKHQ